MEDEGSRIHPIWISHRQPDGQWNIISTGLRGHVDEDGDFIIPFRDEMTAEEVSRLIIGTIRHADGTVRGE